MKETFILYILLVFIILLLVMAAQKMRIAAPLLLDLCDRVFGTGPRPLDGQHAGRAAPVVGPALSARGEPGRDAESHPARLDRGEPPETVR